MVNESQAFDAGGSVVVVVVVVVIDDCCGMRVQKD